MASAVLYFRSGDLERKDEVLLLEQDATRFHGIRHYIESGGTIVHEIAHLRCPEYWAARRMT